MPIIVLVAVLNNMFSITSEIPRRLMVTVAVFFIIFVNVAKGLAQADPIHLELMSSYGATNAEVIRKVKVPAAVSFFFVGVRQCAPVAVVTAFVGWIFVARAGRFGSVCTVNCRDGHTFHALCPASGPRRLLASRCC